VEIFFSKNVVEDYVDAAVKQALQIHLTPSKGKDESLGRTLQTANIIHSLFHRGSSDIHAWPGRY
jgi:pre-mRNA-splicing factor ATP-dependent RNA helicase DHX38/PRP16